MRKENFWMRFAGILVASLLLTVGAALAQEKAPAKGQSKTLDGVVTDAMCGAEHTMMGNTPPKQCVLGCVKGGSQYGLVVGKKSVHAGRKQLRFREVCGGESKGYRHGE